MRTALSILIIGFLGFYAFSYQTDGFSVVTTESARRQNIKSQPLDVKNVSLLAADSIDSALADNIKNDGRTAIVNFIYTRCADVCISMGIEFQQLQKEIIEKKLDDKVRLISISFDDRDNAKWLTNYSNRMQLNPDVWQVYLAKDKYERKKLLKQFGIVVIPAPLGQFEHNAAYHIVTPQAKLNNIVDIDQPNWAMAWALSKHD